MAYYVFDDAKNLFEGMTKEQIVNAIAAATGLTPEQIDADVITSAIKEQNAQKSVNLWIGTQNEYNAIQQPDENTLYVVTDPHETNELQNQIDQLQAEMNTIVAAATTNASGYVIQRLESDPQPLVYNSTFQWYEVANNFVVPEGAEILEYCWKRYESDNHTSNIYASRESDTVVKVVYHSESQEIGDFILSLVISYPQPITLPELTDIRVGYDGTVYGSAGEAVRRQIFKVGFNDHVKSALLNLLAHVAYIDENGQQYYNALERAMYKTAGVTSITAVFDQGANDVYDTDDLDTLRQYLTVTAFYEDHSSEVITDYILSGTLEAGTSTITVSYGGKTDTFDVTVEQLLPSGYTHLKYVTANGNQYVNTGVNETQAAAAEYEVMITSHPKINGNHILSSTNVFFPFFKGDSGDYENLLGIQRGGAQRNASYRWSLNTKYAVTAYLNGTNAVNVNGENATNPTDGTTFSSSNNFYLFTYGGALTNTTYRYYGRLYSMKIYNQNGEVIRHFVPCKNSSNVAGLYDRVTQTFYQSGSGTALIAGEVA